MIPHKKPYFLEVSVNDLVLDKTVQMRASLNRSAIIDYADLKGRRHGLIDRHARLDRDIKAAAKE